MVIMQLFKTATNIFIVGPPGQRLYLNMSRPTGS